MLDKLRHHWNVSTRRQFFTRAGSGLAGIALADLLSGDGYAAPRTVEDPLAPKQPHHPPMAKSVIWLFMEGGPSHVDLFDPKPALAKLDGKPIPDSIPKPSQTSRGTANNLLMASKRTWKQYGETGAWVSDLLPNIAKHVDNISFLKGCKTEGSTHVISSLKLHTSALTPGRPSLGAWITYGLGSANPDLPAFVVLPTGKGGAGGGNGQVIWSAGFLPATYQGTSFRQGDSPILFLDRPERVGRGLSAPGQLPPRALPERERQQRRGVQEP